MTEIKAHAKTEQTRREKPARHPQQQGEAGARSFLFPDFQTILANPTIARAEDILQLQQAAGNRAVTGLIQRKVTVGAIGDRYEQEADRISRLVTSMADPAPVQRLSAGYERDQLRPKRSDPPIESIGEGSFALDDGQEKQVAAMRGGGRPLPDQTRTYMEKRFQADFSRTHIHTGGAAEQLNRKINAQAFTLGNDIFMGEGKFNPGTESGRRLLAHELTHVIQQGGAGTLRVQPKLNSGRDNPSREAQKETVVQADLVQGSVGHVIQCTRKEVDGGRFIAFKDEDEPVNGKLSGDDNEYVRKEFKDEGGFHYYQKIPPRRRVEKPKTLALGETPASVTTVGTTGPTGGTPVKQAEPSPEEKERLERAKKRSEEDKKVREAWSKKKAEIGEGLFTTAETKDILDNRKGSFEYVALNYFGSMEAGKKEKVRKMFYQLDKSNPDSYVYVRKNFETPAPSLALLRRQMIPYAFLDTDEEKTMDEQKREILDLILSESVGQYQDIMKPGEDGKPKKEASGLAGKLDKSGKMGIQDIQSEMNGLGDAVKAPDLVNDVETSGLFSFLRSPKSVAIGFHGTDKPMSVVTAKQGAKVAGTDAKGWGGLKQGKELPFKQTEFGLDEPWNPLKDKISKPSYRKGQNWDNELLSTVSLATYPAPAIKFPFAKEGDATKTTYLYAAVFEKAYPTFKVNLQGGSPFSEVAVDKVDPKEIIGAAEIRKIYVPPEIKSRGEHHHVETGFDGAKFNTENFAYQILSEFQLNPLFAAEYNEDSAGRILAKANEQLRRELGNIGTWGYYNSLKIKGKDKPDDYPGAVT